MFCKKTVIHPNWEWGFRWLSTTFAPWSKAANLRIKLREYSCSHRSIIPHTIILPRSFVHFDKSLFTSYSTSSSGWRSADQQGWSVRTFAPCKRGRDQFHQYFTSYPFYSIFPWFSAFKMVSSVFGVHKCYFGLFSLQPLRFSLFFEALCFFFEEKLHPTNSPQTRSITVTDCFKTVFV